MANYAMLEYEGDYRGTVEDYGIRKGKESKSIGINVLIQVKEVWDSENQSWEPYDHGLHVYGTVWVIGKEGNVLERGMETACTALGWDGGFTSISTREWKPTPCSCSVKSKKWEDNISYEAAFINEYDRTPGGGMKVLDEAEAKSLQAQFGAQLKGLAGQFKRNKTVPPAGSKPKAPPPSRKLAPATDDELQGVGLDDFDFSTK